MTAFDLAVARSRLKAHVRCVRSRERWCDGTLKDEAQSQRCHPIASCFHSIDQSFPFKAMKGIIIIIIIIILHDIYIMDPKLLRSKQSAHFRGKERLLVFTHKKRREL
jgi:hypothetical protein